MPSAKRRRPDLEAGIDRVVQRFLVDNDVPGAAVGVVRGGQLLYAKGHGVRSVERQEPVVVNTLFQIGSVTKVFTTTLLVQLRDEGRLALDDRVDQYLPAHVTPPWSRKIRSPFPRCASLRPTALGCRGILPTAATVRAPRR